MSNKKGRKQRKRIKSWGEYFAMCQCLCFDKLKVETPVDDTRLVMVRVSIYSFFILNTERKGRVSVFCGKKLDNKPPNNILFILFTCHLKLRLVCIKYVYISFQYRMSSHYIFILKFVFFFSKVIIIVWLFFALTYRYIHVHADNF